MTTSKLTQLEIAWNEAAREMVQARQNYHKATSEKQAATNKHQAATNKHQAAKAAYIAEKDRSLGVESENDDE